MMKLDDCKIGRWLHDNPIKKGDDWNTIDWDEER